MSETCDVAVVGAGPAGSVTALLLARSGLAVRLLEKKTFPRRKVCGACLSESAVTTLNSLGLDAVLRNAVPLEAFHLAANGRAASVPLRGGRVLSRRAFDAALVAEAVQAGVVFEDGVTADVGPSVAVSRAIALRSTLRGDRTLNANIVVFAAGLAGSAFRHDPALRSQSSPSAYVGAGAECECASEFFIPGTIYMATHRAGYAGMTRTEDGLLNIAAALDARFVAAEAGMSNAVTSIVREAGFPAEGLADLDWTGTPPLTRRPAALATDRLFLIGDAAGYVEPFTGEGMGWAIGAAARLAPIVTRASEGWSSAYVDEWTRTYQRTIGRRQRVCRMIAHGLRSRMLVSAAIRVLQPFPKAAGPVLRHLATS